jgi:hypothetical protein
MLFKVHIAASLAIAFFVTGCAGNGSGSSAKTTPLISWATPAPVGLGTVLSATQLDAISSAAGTFVYTPAAGTVMSVAGNQTLSATFTPTDTADYNTVTTSVVLAVNGAATPSYTWSNVQVIAGGFVDGIVMHPMQQGLMYARTDVGGAYRWNSTTTSWTPLTDFVTRANSNYIGIESIGIDPSDPQRLYLAAGTYAESYGGLGAMLVSTNQGASFTTVPLTIKLGSNDNGRNAGERLSVDPNLGSKIYFGSRLNGLWQSTNYGATWSQSTTFPVTGTTSGGGVVFEVFVKSTGTSGTATPTIYAGVSATGTGTDPQSLYVSTNGGTTWAAVPGAPTGLYVSHGQLGPDGKLYLVYGDQIGPAGLTTGAVWQYTLPTTGNPNGTWLNITPPRPSGTQGGYGAVTLDPQQPGVIMVSSLDHYYPVGDTLWRSTTYGTPNSSWYSIDAGGAPTVQASWNASLAPYIAGGASTITSTGNWVAALAIDPFNSNHVVYGTGGMVWSTSNMAASDTGTGSQWTVGAQGIEETVVEGLISPPSGPANLLSVMGDLGGFQHTSLTSSPAAGAFSNPGFSTGTGIDFAQSTPSTMVRVGYGSNAQLGAYSSNYGASWTPFATNPKGVVNGAGSVAVSANGSTIVWAPSDSGAATSYSTNNGTSWTACTGAAAQQQVVADRIASNVFYMYDTVHGQLLMSTNSGASFTVAQTGLPTNGTLTAAYDVQGDLWLSSSSGLYHFAGSSTATPTLTAVNGVSSAWALGIGAAATGSKYLTLYLGGYLTSAAGGQLFRSTDNGVTWIRIDDAAHEYAYFNVIVGDPRVFGRVYLGTGGRGIVQGNSPY